MKISDSRVEFRIYEKVGETKKILEQTNLKVRTEQAVSYSYGYPY